MKKNLLSSILVYVALAIAAATMIPFIDKTVGTNEILIKFVIFPVAVLAIAAFAAFVGKKQGTKASLRQGLYAGSVACVAYIAAVCVYAFTYALRASNIAGIIVSLVAACLFAFFGFKLNKVQEKLPVFCALAVMVFAAGGFATVVCQGYINDYIPNATLLAFIFAAVCAVAIIACLVIPFAIESKAATDEQITSDEKLYAEMTDEQLKSVYF